MLNYCSRRCNNTYQRAHIGECLFIFLWVRCHSLYMVLLKGPEENCACVKRSEEMGQNVNNCPTLAMGTWYLLQYSLNSSIHFITTKRIAAAAKSLQSCPTLCDPTDGSPPGSPVPGILQARTLK